MSYPKVGHIDFLNVLPLTYSYKHGYSKDLLIKYDVPSILNDDIKNDRLDISQISSIEYANMYDKLLILPDICVRSNSDVESIVLLSKKTIEDITDDKISLTSKSATSHCLLKIILSEKYRAKPKYEVKNINVDFPILEGTTASLFIGDDALQIYLNKPKNLYCYDLGKEWHNFTGRSMVYAVWVARKSFADKSPELLQFVYDKIISGMKNGLNNKNAAINFVINTKKISYNDLNYYLGNVIRWNLTDDDIDSLILYYELAHKIHLIDKIPEINFANVNRQRW